MKNIYILFVGCFLVFCSGCSKAPLEFLLDSFEGDVNSKTVDFGSSENSSLIVSGDKEVKICGEQSLRLDFELKPSGYMWVARGYKLDTKGAARWEASPEDINWADYNAFSLYMHGSNSGGIIAFDVKDSGGELWRFFIDDSFLGWKKVVCPLAEFFPRGDWQPESADKNEVLDFPILSFQFEPRIMGKGIYYFDCVKLARVKR